MKAPNVTNSGIKRARIQGLGNLPSTKVRKKVYVSSMPSYNIHKYL